MYISFIYNVKLHVYYIYFFNTIQVLEGKEDGKEQFLLFKAES